MADKKSRGARSFMKVEKCEYDVCCGNGECRTTNNGSVGDLTITVNADMEDAITGFKALQRELRETTKAARELEQAYKDVEKAIDNRMGSDGEMRVEIDGKKVAKAVYATDFNLSTHRDLSEVPTVVLREELSKRNGEGLK